MWLKKNSKILFLLAITIISCIDKPSQNTSNSDDKPLIVNGDDEAKYNEIKSMNLDSIYPNLLDPQNSTEANYKEVQQSWSDFHQQVSQYLKDKEFDWEVQDSTITVFNRIYFSEKGTVDYYTFKIMNPSVLPEKRLEFQTILKKFSENIALDLIRDGQYAQCGKTKYLNY